MSKASVVDLAKPVNDLLEIVPRNLLLQPPRLAQDDKKVRLIRWKHEVRIHQVFEDDLVSVETFDHIWVLHFRKDLLLIFGLINLAVKLLVQLHNYIGLCRPLAGVFIIPVETKK